MRIRCSALIMAAICAVVFSSAALAQANQAGAAKGAKAAPGPAPARDISGVWAGPVQARMNTTPPMTELGQKLFAANSALGGVSQSKIDIVAAGVSNDPAEKCDPSGIPLAVVWNLRGMQFIQAPTKMVQLYQYQKMWREIWTDGRALPKNAGTDAIDAPDPRYYGYSIGHWQDDNTFVVETNDTDADTWLDNNGDPHSNELKVTEAYHRPDHDHMLITVNIDDPKAYTQPFVLGTVDYTWNEKQEFEEQLCIPSDAQAYMSFIAGPAGGKK